MKLKLDLHPLYNDSRRIEAALLGIIEDAVNRRAAEVEIIPGKGSGALKKTVLRFLDRPEIKARYHRLEKDSDNWGRLLLHFRPARGQAARPDAAPETAEYVCFCCQAAVAVPVSRDALAAGREARLVECPSCGSPNRLTVRIDRQGEVRIDAESGYL